MEKSSGLGSAADGARAGRCERDPHGGGRGGRHRVPHQRGAAGQQQQPGPCLPAGVADISPGIAGQWKTATTRTLPTSDGCVLAGRGICWSTKQQYQIRYSWQPTANKRWRISDISSGKHIIFRCLLIQISQYSRADNKTETCRYCT